jgi:16S rRNA (cytidine1402-2'-O)-methyltransferase
VSAGAGRLLVVATPLGNLGDLTPRALEALRSADLVACEDTRRTTPMLRHFGLSTKTISCHKFNETARLETIVASLREGRTIALVSDAGTPAVSDPGARLVAAAREAGIRVEAIPGPCAAAAAASVSGFESTGFVFAGFAPARGAARRRFLRALLAGETARASADPAAAGWPIVLYEAPHRIEELLEDLKGEAGDRRAVLLREMTKLHEETLSGALSDLLADLRARPRRGEFTVVLEGSHGGPAAVPETASTGDLRAAYEKLIGEGMDRREALRTLSRRTGIPRSDLYKKIAGGG